jgi:hypothetical protein
VFDERFTDPIRSILLTSRGDQAVERVKEVAVADVERSPAL